MRKVHWLCGVALVGVALLSSGKVHAATEDEGVTNTQTTNIVTNNNSENSTSEQVNENNSSAALPNNSSSINASSNNSESTNTTATTTTTNKTSNVENTNSTVKINYTGKGQVAIWDDFEAPHKIVKYVPKNTEWKTFKVATLPNNNQWYNLGGNQWVDGRYAIDTKNTVPGTSNSSTDSSAITSVNKIITVNYSGKGKVAIWSSYGENKTIKQYVAPNTNWVVTKQASDTYGKTWYDLGNNQWLDGQYAKAANGIVYYGRINSNVFCKDGQIQTGKIINGKQTLYTDKNGAIYRVQLNVPVISQLPQLPTGCEMTAVTMMLQYAGVNINKLQVAAETPRSNDGNKGFVGNPYSPSGWWVFPSGIAPVVNKYLGHSDNLTGTSITTIKNKLLQGHPVVAWVANMNGFVNHAITLTGYSTDGHIYYNNPWTGKSESMSESNFINHWTADKKRALSY